jgi:hypothetical protein
MADYIHVINASNTMMIRDLGGWVEFWFKTGPSTWNNDQWWSWGANGTSSRQKFRLLRGGNWQLFGSIYVGYDQTIRFTIEGAGLGWPTTDFFQFIQRATVPGAPIMQEVTPISSSAFHVVFVGTYDGGSAVLEWQIGYGLSPSGPSALVGSGGVSDVGGFSSGQRVYFWARGRNSIGWSAWSNRLDGVTWSTPPAPNGPTILEKSQVSVRLQYVYGNNPGNAPILERQIGYGLNSSAPTDFITDSGGVAGVLLEDLNPGGSYYFWARSRNSVGWGSWSVRSRIDLIAGALILVGSEWKRAVPYVRVSGVWKVAEPWVKTIGTWRSTAL